MNSPFVEVADRVWVSRREWLDTNVTVIGGDDGLLLVDSHGSTRAGEALVADVRALGAGEVVGLVNTHWHFDHTFGNGAVRATYGDVPVHAHEAALEEFAAHAEGARQTRSVLGHPESEGHHEEVGATALCPPDTTFASVRVLDLGGRLVELIHPGRGHTAGDVVVNVADADVLVAGDLVEQSGAPCYGIDAWPLEWPLTLDTVLGLLRPSTLVVPGHGAVVDREFVQDQRAAVGIVAETVRDLASRGVRESDALASAQWPYLPEGLVHAVARGYEHLPRSQKRLPLI
ncbi:MBL fold metallo-hydrolase [Nocardioides jishulii]|uniref:MBL fold metallo-hydrolase n=1 Tax=Nocardioides jishulii TaxID=2575440 RepID=A0A4U2YHU8_9ACTN|nr:MBL fold metallo-hydrolase [Nocardioides jishulii]QCX27982.1 MBL fold metallo-hydrolase [Nocardioides jishulii]TKI60646.1 MBL fold metallo-hydrolase [Nocardioides jishulii]